MTERDELSEYLGKEVVIDTPSSYLYVGVLADYSNCFVTLRNVDVHDMSDSSSTKETYTMEARRHGVRPNRGVVKIRRESVVSLSLLSDVILYD